MNTGENEDYISEPTADNAHLVRAESFRGKQLAPFGLGLRALWLSLWEASDDSFFSASAMLWLRIRVHEEFNKALTITKDLETAWFMAKSEVLSGISSRAGHKNARGLILSFIESLGRSKKHIDEVMAVAHKTLTEVDESEPEREPGGEGGLDLGESNQKDCPPNPSKSSLSRKKRGSGKKR